jgi:hypothetical protein
VDPAITAFCTVHQPGGQAPGAKATAQHQGATQTGTVALRDVPGGNVHQPDQAVYRIQCCRPAAPAGNCSASLKLAWFRSADRPCGGAWLRGVDWLPCVDWLRGVDWIGRKKPPIATVGQQPQPGIHQQQSEPEPEQSGQAG